MKNLTDKKASRLVIIATVALLLIGILAGCMDANRNDFTEYTMQAVVVGINENSDSVFFETTDGNIWEIEGVEDWNLNDNAELTFSDESTESLLDDIIVSARYTG